MAAVMIGLSAFGILLSPMMAAAALSFSSVSVIGNALRRAQLVTGVACQRSKDVTVRLETHPRSLCRRQVLSVWSLTPEVEEKARGDSFSTGCFALRKLIYRRALLAVVTHSANQSVRL